MPQSKRDHSLNLAPASIDDYRELARRKLPRQIFDYVDGGAFAEVTMTVTAATAGFAFVQEFRGGDVVPQRNTLIGVDGATEIRTPHDDCLLVMPSLRPSRGHTAVRLARFL